MRIGINALYLLPGKVGGSETYVRNLVRNIARSDKINTYIIFINRESIGIFQSDPPQFNIVLCPIQAKIRPLRILWEQIVLPFQVIRYKIDVLFSAGMTAPFLCPARSVLVIYDLQHVNQPRNFTRTQLFFLRVIIYLSAVTADRIITISHHVKNEIIQHYKIKPDAIGVAHLAVNHELFRLHASDAVGAIKVKYDLPERYLLYTAALLPHKNHERLLSAFCQLKDRFPDIKLVLTGAWEDGLDRITKLVTDQGLENDVIFLGWVPFEDLPFLYRGAEIFLYPTLHEGFGLPILEAMASGVPVVCSNIQPLIEVAGNAAFLVDPYDQAAIAKGVVSILQDLNLRDALIKAGLNRAGEFTWEQTAARTLQLIGLGTKEMH